jgi:hypothetical protein
MEIGVDLRGRFGRWCLEEEEGWWGFFGVVFGVKDDGGLLFLLLRDGGGLVSGILSYNFLFVLGVFIYLFYP